MIKSKWSKIVRNTRCLVSWITSGRLLISCRSIGRRLKKWRRSRTKIKMRLISSWVTKIRMWRSILSKERSLLMLLILTRNSRRNWSWASFRLLNFSRRNQKSNFKMMKIRMLKHWESCWNKPESSLIWWTSIIASNRFCHNLIMKLIENLQRNKLMLLLWSSFKFLEAATSANNTMRKKWIRDS
jgi:hypothetical protein